MAIKKQTFGSARTAEELYPPSQDLRNEWGPIYFNERFDLRIDRHALSLTHRSKMVLHRRLAPRRHSDMRLKPV